MFLYSNVVQLDCLTASLLKACFKLAQERTIKSLTIFSNTDVAVNDCAVTKPIEQAEQY